MVIFSTWGGLIFAQEPPTITVSKSEKIKFHRHREMRCSEIHPTSARTASPAQ
jgi:hypothetical protein